jgi:hypothetical protein
MEGIRKRPGRHRSVVDNRSDMSREIIEFINRWLYDVERVLTSRLESLKDDLRSDDAGLREQAAQQADEITDWLYPPPPPLSPEEQVHRVEAAIADKSLSAKERLAAASRAARSTGRSKGRPRDETSQTAIRALGLHLATGMSWREIAMRLKGCAHERPMPVHQKPRKRNPNLSCNDCGEAMRVSVFRLRGFLRQLDYDSDFPRGTSLDEQSRLELCRLWGIEDRN